MASSLDPAGQGVAAAPLRGQFGQAVTFPDRTVLGGPHLELVDGEVLELVVVGAEERRHSRLHPGTVHPRPKRLR